MEVVSFKSVVQYSWFHEFSKMGIFFLLSCYRFTNMELLVSNRSNMKDNPGSTEYQDEFSVHGLKKQETSMESATACSDFTNPAWNNLSSLEYFPFLLKGSNTEALRDIQQKHIIQESFFALFCATFSILLITLSNSTPK